MKKPLILAFLISLLALVACERKAKTRENPILASWEGVYGLPPFNEIKPQDYAPAFAQAFSQHWDEVVQIRDNGDQPAFGNVIVALDNSGKLLERIFRLYSFMAAVDGSQLSPELESEIAVRIADHRDRILHDAELFAKVRSVYDSRESSGLNPVQKRLVERTYETFVNGGAMLGEREKEALRSINASLVGSEVMFRRHIAGASKGSYVIADSSEMNGLPYAVRDSTKKVAAAAGADSLFFFTLDAPVITPVLTVSPNGVLRERLYNGFRNRCAVEDAFDNRPLVGQIADLREEKARLLGFGSYAGYAFRGGMLDGTSGIYAMLDSIWTPALGKAGLENESRKRQITGGDTTSEVRPCDLLFLNNRVLRSEVGMDAAQAEVYFPVANVRLGAFELANRLWGLTFRPVQPDLYNAECEAFEVYDIDGSKIGLFILDYYSRMGKEPWNGVYPLTCDAKDGENPPVPVFCMVFNFLHPQHKERPALLSVNDVRAFFNIVGNSLSRLFVESPYRGLRSADRDISGLTGELLSCWAFQPHMLRRYALHYSSGKLPAESEIASMAAMPSKDAGSLVASDVGAAYLDMDIHSAVHAFTDPHNFEFEQLREKRDMPPFLDPAYNLPEFGYIFGGRAGAEYYTHLWGEVLAADVFERFVQSGDIFDRRTARELREKVLSKGGSVPAAEMYLDFMGREPSLQTFFVAKGFIDPPLPETGNTAQELPLNLKIGPGPAGDSW